MNLKKTTSQKKVLANRQNALHSSGPKTRAGKERSRYNAVKHGLLSAEVVIKSGLLGEDKSEYEALFQELADYYEPVGVVEELLTKEIADSQWRIRRVLKCEVAEIRCQAISGNTDEDRQWKRKFEGVLALSNEDRAMAVNSLKRAITEVQEEKRLSAESKEFLGKHSVDLVPAALRYDGAFASNSDLNILVKMRFLERLLNDLAYLEAADSFGKGCLREDDVEEYEARLDSKTLPQGETLDKILRYESAMKKQWYKAMNQLERLQRSRMGDAVPPPISVQISKED